MHVGLQNIVDLEVLKKGEADGEEDAVVSFVGLGDGGRRATATRRSEGVTTILQGVVVLFVVHGGRCLRELEVVANVFFQLRKVLFLIVQSLLKERRVQWLEWVVQMVLFHGFVRDEVEDTRKVLGRRVLLV